MWLLPSWPFCLSYKVAPNWLYVKSDLAYPYMSWSRDFEHSHLQSKEGKGVAHVHWLHIAVILNYWTILCIQFTNYICQFVMTLYFFYHMEYNGIQHVNDYHNSITGQATLNCHIKWNTLFIPEQVWLSIWRQPPLVYVLPRSYDIEWYSNSIFQHCIDCKTQKSILYKSPGGFNVNGVVGPVTYCHSFLAMLCVSTYIINLSYIFPWPQV